MPWYVYIALKQLFPSGKFFTFFTFLSILGVAIGVWVLIAVQSVMNGFGDDIRQKLVDTGGHVIIKRAEPGALIEEVDIVGVNNRNLRTFDVDLETTIRLRPAIPEGIVVVGESGIRSRADAVRLEEAGVDAMLVGESLMRRPDPGEGVRELLGM